MQIELLIKEKVLLEEAVAESKLAIAAIKVAETQMKGTLNELENMFSRLNCEQAETEGELE